MLTEIKLDSDRLNLNGMAANEQILIDFLNYLNSSSLINQVNLSDIEKKEEVFFTITGNILLVE